MIFVNERNFGIFILVLILSTMFTGCSSNDKYQKTFESGLKKYYSGEKMTKQEYNAVKGFNDWKSKQGPKTYSGWDK